MKRYLLGLLATCAFASPASAAVILFDGFEQPAQNGGFSYGVNSQFATLAGGAAVQANGSAFNYNAAPEGVQTATIQGLGTITFNLAGLDTNKLHTLSYFAATRPGLPANSYTVSFANQLLGTFTPGSSTFNQLTLNFTPTASNGALVFAGTNPNPVVGNDRNVAIDAVSLSAVPEPATWAMMIIGFGLIGFGLRSRRQQPVRVIHA